MFWISCWHKATIWNWSSSRSQDAILLDEEKMDEINEKLENLNMGSCAESIRNDLSKCNMIFSEESSRAIYEMGNMEMIELRLTLA